MHNLAGFVAKHISGANPDKAVQRVQAIKVNTPDLPDAAVVETLIKAKCKQAAAISAGTSAAGIVPGLGTVLSLTLGLAVDIGSTLKLHSELVQEIAEAYGRKMTDRDRTNAILAVTGVSTGFNAVSERAVTGLSRKAGEMTAQKWLSRAVPFLGIAASAGTNVVSTYIIGKRAKAYFTKGPDAVQKLEGHPDHLSRVDKRWIFKWLSV